MLEVRDLHTFYGSIHVLKGISLFVDDNEIVTLMGSNGAGKTTLINSISGILRPNPGEIFFNGKRIDHLQPHDIVRQGISQVPEGRKIYSDLSVLENLHMGAFIRKNKIEIAGDVENVLALFPGIRQRCSQRAGTLSGGEQQMLAIARALMARPRLLLLDEPSMGLAPMLVEKIFNAIKDINTKRTTILLVEQNASIALQIASRGYVIQTGRIVLEGSSENLRKDDMIRKLYLGVEM
ncbi:ABC transporter ATP-binding protein [Thermodesulfobacteriota bacterium]